MYGGYQGTYGAYGQQQYAAANAAHQYQQGQPQQQHQYYAGVNPYANYGYGGINAPLPPPPPPPPAPTDYTAESFRTFPSQATKLPTPAAYFKNKAQHQQQGVYNGYDAAIYQFAQQNTTGGPQKTWKHGGGGRVGRQSSGDNKQYYCEVCKISCAGGITYKEHLEGQRHKKKEVLAKQGLPSTSLAKNKLSYRCETCDVTCTGQDTYNAHVNGGKHQKTVNLHKKMGKHVPENVPTIIAPGENGPTETKAKSKWHQQTLPGSKKVIGINTVQFVGGTKLNSTGQLEEKKREVAIAVGSVGMQQNTIEAEDEEINAMIQAEHVQPVGEEYVEEEKDATGKLIQFKCKLCDCKFSDPNAKEIHIKGRRHRLSYRQKIDSSLIVDMKPSNKRSKDKYNKGQQQQQMQDQLANPLRAIWFEPPTPQGRELNIFDERTVEKKYQELNPGIGYFENINKLVDEIGGVLHAVSAKIENEKELEEKTEAAPSDNERPCTILGCARVGVFATNAFIKGEEYLEMVVSSTPIPTVELVQKVKKLFADETMEKSMSIEDDATSPVCLIVTATWFPNLKVRLLVTSTAVRNDDEATKTECVDKETCLYALALIRRSKWFESHCHYLNSCHNVVRFLRDMGSRHSEWMAIDCYRIQLLVANIIDSSPISLSPSEAFKRVLEALSAGYLYSAILIDPCETTKPNVLDALTDEQKHKLTSSAQHFVRMIAFNQIHEVLGIDRLTEMVPEIQVLKRPLDSEEPEDGDDGEPDYKREKYDGDDDDEEQECGEEGEDEQEQEEQEDAQMETEEVAPEAEAPMEEGGAPEVDAPKEDAPKIKEESPVKEEAL